MAGSGRRTFAPGEVLTASNVMNYLQDQAVMVFAGTAARGSAIGTAVSEGMVSYLQDSNQVQVYDGSSWDSISRIKSPNFVINGGFDIWQRGSSFAPITDSTYAADRWLIRSSVAPTSRTVERKDLSAAITELQNVDYYLRSTINTIGSGSNVRIRTAIENVGTLANETVVLSWWGKHNSSANLTVVVSQVFGAGGSATVTPYNSTVAYTNVWQRFEVSFSMPSIAGKTIGANNYIQLEFYQNDATNSVLDITGVQLEAGSAATTFRRVGSSIQGELAACQRYYFQTNAGGSLTASNAPIGMAVATANNTARCVINFPSSMRIAPSTIGYSALTSFNLLGVSTQDTTNVTISGSTPEAAFVTFTTGTTMTAGQGYLVRHKAATDYISFSADL